MADDAPRKKSGTALALLKKLLTSSTGGDGSSSSTQAASGTGSSSIKRLSLSVGDGSAGKSKWGDVTKRKASLMVLGDGEFSPTNLAEFSSMVLNIDNAHSGQQASVV
ncbi:hypothetical protein PoB_007425800 [Plakobranchus ocellatus]|uniref:Uncharacterized protein n=1 Tax=Plakobranchus ocellatus TaxID=259542 RepID=A0AAV4DUH5_9GAST|nr:hypothetical protein PoB_007425800 [Plakobranchus ocellatus]